MSNIGPAGQGAGPAPRRRRVPAKQVFVVAAIAVLALFALLNTQRVKIDWIVTTTHTPLVLALLVAALLGALVGSGLSYARARRKRAR